MYSFEKPYKPFDFLLTTDMKKFTPIKLSVMICLKAGDFYRPPTEVNEPCSIPQDELDRLCPTIVEFHPVCFMTCIMFGNMFSFL